MGPQENSIKTSEKMKFKPRSIFLKQTMYLEKKKTAKFDCFKLEKEGFPFSK